MSAKLKITPEQILVIKQMRNQGVSYEKIAKELSIAKATVIRYDKNSNEKNNTVIKQIGENEELLSEREELPLDKLIQGVLEELYKSIVDKKDESIRSSTEEFASKGGLMELKQLTTKVDGGRLKAQIDILSKSIEARKRLCELAIIQSRLRGENKLLVLDIEKRELEIEKLKRGFSNPIDNTQSQIQENYNFFNIRLDEPKNEKQPGEITIIDDTETIE